MAQGKLPVKTDPDDDCPASARGIMHCLRMLADEAASLKLARTLFAITTALETCELEFEDGPQMAAATPLH